jgi:hypothetical protein
MDVIDAERPILWPFVCSLSLLLYQSERIHRRGFCHPPKQKPETDKVRRTHPGPRHCRGVRAHFPRLHLEWDSPPPGTSVTRRPANAPWKWKSAPEVPECQERDCGTRHAICEIAYAGSKSLFTAVLRCRGFLTIRSLRPKWVPLCLLRKKTSLGLILVACWRRSGINRGATGVNGFADTSVRTGPGPKLQRVFFQGHAADEGRSTSRSGGREALLISVEIEIPSL